MAGRGRPKVADKATFRNVAVPLEIYDMIKELSRAEERTIARQLAVLIKNAHENHFQA
jgi:molybdenum cofactor biosynthesis enzyme